MQCLHKPGSLDAAQQSSETYVTPNTPTFSTAVAALPTDYPSESTIAAVSRPKCYFCENSKHPCHKYPAKEAVCRRCQKKGHFANVCRSNPASTRSEQSNKTASVYFASISCIWRDIINKGSALGCSLLNALYQNFFTVYQKLEYTQVAGKAAEDCMLAAIREVEAISDYSYKGGNVYI